MMNRCRPWLPPIIALSASSPFWLGAETGYASYRTQLFSRWPMAGMPQVFASRSEYDDLVGSLVAVGMIADASKIYWDARPSSHAETLEFRVADVCPTIDEAVMVAGLCRALARTCLEQHRSGVAFEVLRPGAAPGRTLARLSFRARRRAHRRLWQRNPSPPAC